MNIGVIGLGHVGQALVSNPAKAGHGLTISDGRREVAEALLRSGADRAGSRAGEPW